MSKSTKYQQIEDFIKLEIDRGTLKKGDKIMTEEQLCDQFGFSRMTVNKALNHLSDLGYIQRIPGKGSFVAAHHTIMDSHTSIGFTEDMQELGFTAGSKLLSYEVLHGRDVPVIANKLRLEDSDLIHYFVRLRTGNETPFAVSYTFVSANVIPAINVECLSGSFYSYLDSLGIMRYCKEIELKAYMPNEEQTRLLEISNTALLCTSQVTYTDQNEEFVPFEYVETYYNGDFYTYVARI